jgi:hypothetical protein
MKPPCRSKRLTNVAKIPVPLTAPPRRQWQFWALLLSVLLVAISPSLRDNGTAWEAGAINAAVTGMILLVLAVFSVERHACWTDGCQIGGGLWLTSSPYMLGYGSTVLAQRHFAIGMVLIASGVFSLLQERIGRLFRAGGRH